MPELPEVEVVKKSLQRDIINLTIKKVKIINKNLRYKIDVFKLNKLIGKTVVSIKRRAKYLLINFNNKSTLIVHLGMTGKFYIEKKKIYKKLSFYYKTISNNNKHDHVIISFNKEIKLIYNDVRRFGFIKIISTNLLIKNSHFSSLGIEPLSKYFNQAYFKSYIKNKKKSVKDMLMDQKFIAGLGNIYVNEILFKCSVYPKKNIQELDTISINKIIKFTKIILKKAVSLGGSSINDFENSNKKRGKFQEKFNVYDKTGSNCPNLNCNKLVKKIYISNRSTYYCENCQK